MLVVFRLGFAASFRSVGPMRADLAHIFWRIGLLFGGKYAAALRALPDLLLRAGRLRQGIERIAGLGSAALWCSGAQLVGLTFGS